VVATIDVRDLIGGLCSEVAEEEAASVTSML